MVETFLIRSIHDELNGRYDAIPYGLCTNAVSQAAYELYELFINSNGQLDHTLLMIKKHALWIAILEDGLDTEAKVGGVMDRALIALSLNQSGQWKKASLVRSSVTCILWVLSAITAHSCRLAINGQDQYDSNITASPETYAGLISSGLFNVGYDASVISPISEHGSGDDSDDDSGDDSDTDEEGDGLNSDDDIPNDMSHIEANPTEQTKVHRLFKRLLRKKGIDVSDRRMHETTSRTESLDSLETAKYVLMSLTIIHPLIYF